jgi:coenzyme F420-dependent oxidoreductase
MTARDLHLPVAAQPSLSALVSLGISAESAGYDRVWVPETWGRDAVTTLTRLATETDTVGLGTSIVPVYSRSPALVGQTAATLQEHSDKRMRVGVGPSGPAVVENWHGSEFARPLKRTREFVEIVRTVTTGEVVSYDGEIFDVEGFRLRFDSPGQVPVDVAAMGPTAVELAGRFADGWHALLFTPDGLTERLEDLARGAELGDRSLDDVRVTLVVTCAALEDRERARTLARQHVAFYIGGMGTFYRDALARQGHADVAERIHDAWAAGDRREAVAAVGDELLDALVAAGTPETARRRLHAFAALDGVDAVAVSLPRGAKESEIAETVRSLAPDG